MVYDAALEAFLSGGLRWRLGEHFKALLAADAYTPAPGHRLLADVPPGARLTVGMALTGLRTGPVDPITGIAYGGAGAAFANDQRFIGVRGGTAASVVVYHESGAGEANVLVAAPPAAIVPDGRDVLVTWDARGVFRI